MPTDAGSNAPPAAEPAQAAGGGCLLVLGMHRSGTSAVTSVLARLGVGVGDPGALHPADESNPRGYWEPAELIALDDALLESWGGSQRAPQLCARPASTHDLPTPLVERMSDYAKGWDAHLPYVWKDPRLCITLPLWRPLLPVRGVVLAARHPAAVADSLAARDRMSHATGLVLWEAYVRSLLAALDDTPRTVVRYEALLEEPEGVVEALASFAERTVGGGAGGDRDAALRGIERRRVPAPDDAAPSPAQHELYRRLCAGEADPDALADRERLALLDSATAIGAELTRQRWIASLAEEKIERLRRKAPVPSGGWVRRLLQRARGRRPGDA